VRKPVPHYEVPKVFVQRHNDTKLTDRHPQKFAIKTSGSEFAGKDDVVALTPEPVGNQFARALIDQESHRTGAGTTSKRLENSRHAVMSSAVMRG
jgi:hypothetical protein